MPLNAPRYRIALANDPNIVHEVTVVPADQLRAEVEGNRRGLVEPARQGMLLTMLWLWAACRRTGLAPTDEAFDRFVDSLLVWERVKVVDVDGLEVSDAVPPTSQAVSSTASSSSQRVSPASTGSQPSTTTPPSSPQPHASWDSTTPSSEVKP